MYNNEIDDQGLPVKIDDTTLTIIQQYVYLEQSIYNSGAVIPEINRTKRVWFAFGRNPIIFKSGMLLHLEKNTFDQCILPVPVRMRNMDTEDRIDNRISIG